jgi:hypothetical protein
MPAASAPFLFSKFIEGYQQGAQQTQMARLKKAQSLMQIAQMRAKEVDTADTSEGRAQAWAHVTESMDEAEKLMKGSDGLWSTIMGVFKKKQQKQQLQDPHEMFGGLIHPDSYENKSVTFGGPQQQQGPGIASTVAQPSPESNDYSNTGGMPEQTPARNVNKDGVAIERPAPGVLGGPPTVPEVPLSPPRITGTTMSFPQPVYKEQPKVNLPEGVTTPDKATGQGIEMVQVAPGRTEYRVNGRPTQYGEWEKMRQAFESQNRASELRRTESKERIDEATAQHNAELRQTEAGRARTADAWAEWRRKNNLPVDPEYYEEIFTGVKRSQPRTTNADFKDENGDNWREVRDLETGQSFPGSRYKLPSTAEDQKIKPFMTGGRTYAQASTAYYNNVMADENVKDRVRRAQADNLDLTIANKKQLQALREKKENLGRADIQKAMSLLSPIARAAATAPMLNSDGTMNPNAGQFNLSIYNGTLHALMLSDMGLTWDQVITAYKGDPLVALNAPVNEGTNYARGAGGAGSEYNPKK